MLVSRCLLFTDVLLICVLTVAQQTSTAQVVVQRDTQAVTAVRQAISAMGSTVPSDAIATGTITIIAGSSTDQGTVRILTRGTNQTSEQIQTPQTEIAEVFSGGLASQIVGNNLVPFSGNRAATTQTRDFPLPLLAGLLANPDESLRLIGLEQGGTSTLTHIRATNTFSSQAGLQVLSEFTPADIWIDAQTALPVRIAWIQRDGGGASPRISRETLFSNYRAFGGVLYPTTIEKYCNGMLWMQITVQAVTFKNGLSDSNFPVPAVQQ